MAKSRRKISSSQRDKSVIEMAKKLKKAGILSPKANLHSGRFVSRGVLKKVVEQQQLGHLNYRAVKVSKAVAKAAQERGYITVRGNYIVGPNERRFRERIAKGDITGIQPIKGAYLEIVELPHSVYDMRSLVERLKSGIDTLKMPDEYFAFRFHGHMSRKPFLDSQELIEYLMHYKGIFEPGGSLRNEDLAEEFAAFEIFRLHRNATGALIPDKETRRRMRRAEGKSGRSTNSNRKGFAERMSEVHPRTAMFARQKRAAKRKAEREALKANDPKAYEKYKEASRARAKASYDKRFKD